MKLGRYAPIALFAMLLVGIATLPPSHDSRLIGHVVVGPISPAARFGEPLHPPALLCTSVRLGVRKLGETRIRELTVDGRCVFSTRLPSGRYQIVPLAPGSAPLQTVDLREGEVRAIVVDVASGPT